MNLYRVTAISGSPERIYHGTGIVEYVGFCEANSEEEAIDKTEEYSISPAVKYNKIIAEFVKKLR